ncbi:MAG: MgtC/SapB family protein [Clostridiales bacterium]|jgi:putative Mg2+ transporter-C (MgtC) family protein|nr:MgtC/SapB family protein [Clostridiales bacterium]
MAGISILEQFEYVLRVVIAAICGGLIGFERERRIKSAGLKTHIIVGIGAALMMVISKYGFFDLFADPNLSENVKLDPSRVASGIVTAVGFLGSGIIFVKNFKTNGVTTAAGLWATVGVGMAFGAGMYLIGTVVSLLILLIQFFFHRRWKLFRYSSYQHLDLLLQGSEEQLLSFSRRMNEKKVLISYITMTRNIDTKEFRMELGISIPEHWDMEKMYDVFQDETCLVSIKT